MGKTYIITESQYKNLIGKKKDEKVIYKQISEELALKRRTLTESKKLNEGIIDTIKSYARRGLLTVTLVASLLASNQVSAQQLIQAGVDKDTVEQAEAKSEAKFNPANMTTKQVEERLVKIMKQNNLSGSLKTFNNLSPEQKDRVLNGIKSKIESLDDINSISFGNWEKYEKTGANTVQFDQKTEEKIRVTTIDSLTTVPVTKNFVFNSTRLENPEALKQELTDLIKNYTEITSIDIVASSSTLRNKDEAENLTWLQLSQGRANAISDVLVGTNIDLGGKGVNLIGKITPKIIHIDIAGTNGDGTSGPKSPYEVTPEFIQSYKDRGIDPKFWQSAAKEDALPETQIDNYNQYQYVTIKIHGRVVITDTQEVPSYKYVTLLVRKAGAKIELGQDRQDADISKCPVHTDSEWN